MRFSIALALLSIALSTTTTTTDAFAPSVKSSQLPVRSRTYSEYQLYSTLAPQTPKEQLENHDESPRGPLSMQIDELAEILGGTGRAKIVWDCYSIGIEPTHFHGSAMHLGYDDFESIYSLLPSRRRNQRLGPETLQRLQELYARQGGKVEGGVASLSYVSRSSDSTTKLLLKLADGLEIETVIIPWNGQRSTLCMSTQVGCRQGCKFCATGRMGRVRDLTADEILAQMFFAKKICRLEGLPDICNIVFMGMGESADNAENVVKATEILTTRELFQLAATKVTVSTVAPTPEAFKVFSKAPCVIAWSVHAANDELRRKLVPTTKYSMSELRQGLIECLLDRPKNLRTTMLEIALMKDVNDTLQEAQELVEFTRVITDSVPYCKLMVNLIPFNDIGNTEFQRPDDASVTAFQKHLQANGVFAHIRTTRGDDKTAACGQLSTKKRKNDF